MTKKKKKEVRFEYARADFTIQQRGVYWDAVNGLRRLVEEGVDREGILSEIEDDL